MVRVRFAQQLILAAVLPGCVACSHVAAYERAAVARPDMTTSDMAGPALQHATQVHEGATRSGAAAEAGCGCN
jgi:hypothetical protein